MVLTNPDKSQLRMAINRELLPRKLSDCSRLELLELLDRIRAWEDEYDNIFDELIEIIEEEQAPVIFNRD